MSCERVQELISPLLDGKATSAEAEIALGHFDRCRSCSDQFQSARSIRRALRTMDRRPVPANLSARLRVLASHERERRIRHVNFSARLRHWADNLRLAFDNMMRPIALPFAGGVMTALLLLGIWVPTLASKQGPKDVPLPYWLYGKATPQEYPVLANELVMELSIDENGRVTDWVVVHGEATPAVLNSLLFWQFDPAMRFGYPISSKVVVSTSSQISVRG